METQTAKPDLESDSLDGINLVWLGRGSGATHADELASLGLGVGDTIRGKEVYGNGWHEARLTVLWVGASEVVYWKRWRSDRFPDSWKIDGETARFSLSCREWYFEKSI